MLLLCLAEALLRIPDAATADRLIAGTIGTGDWSRHLGHSDSLLVNASTWGLMLTGRIIDWSEKRQSDLAAHGPAPDRQKRRAGDPPGAAPGDAHSRQSIRARRNHRATRSPMPRTKPSKGYRFSFDMLGEAARSEEDAERYALRYEEAAEAIASMGPVSRRREVRRS